MSWRPIAFSITSRAEQFIKCFWKINHSILFRTYITVLFRQWFPSNSFFYYFWYTSYYSVIVNDYLNNNRWILMIRYNYYIQGKYVTVSKESQTSRAKIRQAPLACWKTKFKLTLICWTFYIFFSRPFDVSNFGMIWSFIFASYS